jgi:sugar/nucleoside kinase (ribokinase family)
MRVLRRRDSVATTDRSRSGADAEWLFPELPPERVAERVLGLGAQLVVVTLGPGGALARSRAGSARVATPHVAVADTVGAGDAFGAGLLAWLAREDRLEPHAVGELDDEALTEALRFANAVAALGRRLAAHARRGRGVACALLIEAETVALAPLRGFHVLE